MSWLKLEGVILEYSDLTRLEELEALMLWVRGKMLLWNTLKALCASDSRFKQVDVERLQHQAEQQLEGLKKHHLRTARQALDGDLESA